MIKTKKQIERENESRIAWEKFNSKSDRIKSLFETVSDFGFVAFNDSEYVREFYFIDATEADTVSLRFYTNIFDGESTETISRISRKSFNIVKPILSNYLNNRLEAAGLKKGSFRKCDSTYKIDRLLALEIAVLFWHLEAEEDERFVKAIFGSFSCYKPFELWTIFNNVKQQGNHLFGGEHVGWKSGLK